MTHPEEDDRNALQARGRIRVPVDYPAQFTASEGAGHGTVMNLTLAGCEIQSHAQLPIGADVCLHIRPPRARPPITIALAIVRWNQGDRFGLEFVRFEGQAKEQLMDMLNQGEAHAGE